MRKTTAHFLLLTLAIFSGVSCASTKSKREKVMGVSRVVSQKILVSVKDQKMALIQNGESRKVYDISTSKYGLGDSKGSYRTPTGKMQIARKIGSGTPSGTVFKSRRPTGEVLSPNAPGRDPIVSRILWLRGLEDQNRNAYGRCIYIHGTPEERTIGRRRSYGCIRMRSKDVIDLYDRVSTGAVVQVSEKGLGKYRRVPGKAPRFSLAWRDLD